MPSKAMNHSPEPWKFVREENRDYRIEFASKSITNCLCEVRQDHGEFTPPIEDAERIVECVNALPGVPEPVKAVQTLADSVKVLCDAAEAVYGVASLPKRWHVMYMALKPFLHLLKEPTDAD